MKNKFYLKGGIVGIIIGVVYFIYSMTLCTCTGLSMNLDGTFVSCCPKGWINILLSNSKYFFHNIYGPLGLLLILIISFIVFGFIGWIIGRIINRKSVTS